MPDGQAARFGLFKRRQEKGLMCDGVGASVCLSLSQTPGRTHTHAGLGDSGCAHSTASQHPTPSSSPSLLSARVPRCPRACASFHDTGCSHKAGSVGREREDGCGHESQGSFTHPEPRPAGGAVRSGGLLRGAYIFSPSSGLTHPPLCRSSLIDSCAVFCYSLLAIRKIRHFANHQHHQPAHIASTIPHATRCLCLCACLPWCSCMGARSERSGLTATHAPQLCITSQWRVCRYRNMHTPNTRAQAP